MEDFSLSHPDRKKLKQHKREEMFKMRNHYGNLDTTPFEAMEDLIFKTLPTIEEDRKVFIGSFKKGGNQNG